MAADRLTLIWTFDFARLQKIPDYAEKILKEVEERGIQKDEFTITDLENILIELFPEFITLHPEPPKEWKQK